MYTAAKRAKLDVSKKQVDELVKGKAEKQILAPPQKATGKSVSENDNRWMMDLIDVSNVPAGDWKFFLAVVNVFDRYLYVRPLRSKEPAEVAKALGKVLDEAKGEGRKLPSIVSSDNGTEFKNDEVRKVLGKKNAVQKFKDVGDLNALGLLDRTIGLLKRRLAEAHATNKKSWAVNLQAAVAALNKTPKPEVLHGAAPAEVREDPEVKFMMLQEQARGLKKNNADTYAKEAQLKTTGTFRPQVSINKFKRNFQATYSTEPEKVDKVEAGRVYTRKGESYPLKQIKIVPAGAGTVKDFGSQQSRKIDEGGGEILGALEKVLEGGQQMALSTAAGELRLEMRAEGKSYDGILGRVGGQLIDLIRLAPDLFQLVPRPHGKKQTWYFVKLA